jgi:hypothetical protein
MNAYLFTALNHRSQVRETAGAYGLAESFQSWDGCASAIVPGNNPDEAREKFDAWLHAQPEGEHPVDIEVKLVTAAQFVDKLLSESGSAPLDLREISRQVQAQLESATVDDFEQGYWLDVEPVIRPENPSLSIVALQQNLPEDIRTGLNWSADKQFIYLLSIFSPTPLPRGLAELPGGQGTGPDELPEEGDGATHEAELQSLLAMYPQAADKEAAAVIQARNSAVAAWLWRRHAASTRLAANAIRIDPWCGAIGLE